MKQTNLKQETTGQKFITEAVIETEERMGRSPFPAAFRKKLTYVIERKKIFFAGGMLVAANTLGSVLNFAFSAYTGRVLTLSDFALVSLMNSLYSFAALFYGPLSFTVNYRSGFLMGKFDDAVGYQFWKYVRKYGILVGFALSLLWLLASPFLDTFFQTTSLLFFISYAAIIYSSFASGTDKGFLNARLFFLPLAGIVFLEPVLKILFAILLVVSHETQFMYITIPLAFFISFIFGWLYIINHKPKPKNTNFTQKDITFFPMKFCLISILSGLSTLSFASLDIVLAKHYLPPSDAGKYALVSLMGKTVFFLGGLTTPFVVPIISRELGANKDTTRILYILLLCTFVMCFIGFLCFGVFGYITAPLLLGKKAYSIVSYLSLFLFAMMCFCIAQIFVTFYQIRKIYTFPLIGLLLSIVQIILIVLNHSTVFSIVSAMSFVGIANLVVFSLMHAQWKKVQTVENSIVNFFGRRKL